MSSNSTVPMTLNGGRVTVAFRAALFSAAARAGTSVNEFVLRCAGHELVAAGFDIDGVFHQGDLIGANDNGQTPGGRSA